MNSACISYIKDKHDSLLVKGQYDDQTTQMFRTFQTGTSPFTEKSFQNLQDLCQSQEVTLRKAIIMVMVYIDDFILAAEMEHHRWILLDTLKDLG